LATRRHVPSTASSRFLYFVSQICFENRFKNSTRIPHVQPCRPHLARQEKIKSQCQRNLPYCRSMKWFCFTLLACLVGCGRKAAHSSAHGPTKITTADAAKDHAKNNANDAE